MPTLKDRVESILRNSDRDMPAFGRDIPASDVEAIKAAFRSPDAENWQRQLATTYALVMKAQPGRMFGCNCRPKLVGKYPALAVVEGPKNYYLRRVLKGHEDHSPYCVFSRDQDEHVNRKKSYQRPTKAPNFRVLRAFKEIKPTEEPITPTVTRKSKQKSASDSLQKLMWHMISTAGLNILRPGTFQPDGASLENAIQRIRRTVESQVLYPGKQDEPEISVDSVFCTDPRAWWQFAKRLRTSTSWEGRRPTGFLMGLVNFVKPPLVVFAKQDEKMTPLRVNLAGKISVFGDEFDKNFRAPYLALITAGQLTNDNNYIDAIRAYLHPVYSGTIMCPVDSGYERQTIDCLRKALTDLAAYRPFIEKPLYDMNPDKTFGSETLIPDFILRLENEPRSHVLIETMGYRSDDYLTHKAAIINLMQSKGLGTVVRYDAYKRPVDITKAEAFDRAFLDEVFKTLGVPRGSRTTP